ncbi:helix-turn-helix transcriptional regulator [uncultured Megasphaera sp.]|uniref:helix-turn-helix domain-containing protein n=1 Tax=uncultured Megasphaera sp. TaxID=165188 RepID=UPI0025924D7D|nr:helix-turn-helix transcriptional regulator [uncultured Megasphaera sp.]
MNDYAEGLKELLEFVNIRYSVLSKEIGYDLSYVSKWVTGARLPAAKNVDLINQKIANAVTLVTIKLKLSEELKKRFLDSKHISDQDLEFEIYQYLSNRYRRSIGTKKNKQAIETEHTNKSAIGVTDCQVLISNVIDTCLGNEAAEIDILITGDFISLMQNKFWSAFYRESLKKCFCKIDLLINFERLKDDPVSHMGDLFQCLNDFLDFDFTIHEKISDQYSNIIVIKNKAVIYYYLNVEGYIDLCSVITDSEQVAVIFEKCRSFMATLPVVLKPKKTLGMERFGYRDTFYTSDEFFFFCVNGFEFLLPDKVFDSMLLKAKMGDLDPATEEWVERVRAIWENLMVRVSLRFMLPTNSIIRFLETGDIQLTDFSYQLTPEERRDHVKNILEVMKLNPNITFGVLLPTTEKYSGTNFTNLSFNTNYSTGFLKKNLHYIHRSTNPIYFINNPLLLQYFQQFFEHQRKSRHYKEYTVDQLAKLYDQYKFLMDFLFEK